jgi:hypothetical protein
MAAAEPLPAPFIVGVGRSGTTLLRLMLDAHPELAIPAETHFIADLLRPTADRLSRDQFLRVLTQAQTWPNMALDAAVVSNALERIEPFSLSAGLRLFFRLCAGRYDKPRWGDKTPPYRNCMTGIQALLPEARFIHLIRDGRDVALSYRGLWFGPGDGIEVQARFWQEQIAGARQQSTRLRHYLEVRYESLIEEPRATLEHISRFIELPYHPAMLHYHQVAAERLADIKQPVGPPNSALPDLAGFLAIFRRTVNPPDQQRIGVWRREMSELDQRRYQEIAGPLLRELGYLNHED